MALIKFQKHEKELICGKLQVYFSKELDHELGQFDADFLLDFLAEEVGVFFYNQGVQDAKAVLDGRLEDISEAIYEVEKAVPFHR